MVTHGHRVQPSDGTFRVREGLDKNVAFILSKQLNNEQPIRAAGEITYSVKEPGFLRGSETKLVVHMRGKDTTIATFKQVKGVNAVQVNLKQHFGKSFTEKIKAELRLIELSSHCTITYLNDYAEQKRN